MLLTLYNPLLDKCNDIPQINREDLITLKVKLIKNIYPLRFIRNNKIPGIKKAYHTLQQITDNKEQIMYEFDLTDEEFEE
jgi:predicted RNA methylase